MLLVKIALGLLPMQVQLSVPRTKTHMSDFRHHITVKSTSLLRSTYSIKNRTDDNMAVKINFTVLEKEMLMELVAANIETIEDKKNNEIANQRKENAWLKMMERFNSQHGVRKRTCKQLKALWKNMKAKAKKELAADRTSWNGDDETEIGSQYQKGAIMLQHQINGVHNRYDNKADHAPPHNTNKQVTRLNG